MTNVFDATEKLGHDPRNPSPTCDCHNCKPSREILEQQLMDALHEIAIFHDIHKLYPGAWCCKGARNSNGWHHTAGCVNDEPCL